MKSKTLPLWARLACTALAALAFLLVYERLVYGVPFGQIYLPASAWSDEVYYVKQLSAVVTHGAPQGYFGFNESHAEVGRFAAWGPAVFYLYAIPGLIFRGQNAFLYCNLFFVVAGWLCFVWGTRLDWKRQLLFGVGIAALNAPVRYVFSAMQEPLHYALVLAVPVGLAVFSLYAGYIYDPVWPYDHMAILLLSIFLSGRFEIWHNVFWGSPLTLLGGLPTDGDEHHAIDNTFLAVPMNKGVLGAILVAAVFLLLLWRLAKKHRSTEVICLVALTLYLFMENKPFLVSANPFLLMLPVLFFGADALEKNS